MNNLEIRMIEILKELKTKYSAIAVKAEFEAEGTKLEELLRLKEITMLSNMELTLKIGGCESIRDMLEAKVVGVNNIVAPMIESPYALRKYLQAFTKIFPSDESDENLKVFCNIETEIAIKQIDEMLNIPEISLLNGIVIERIDLCHSMDLSDEAIIDEKVNNMIAETCKKIKTKKITTVIGGGVSAHSIPLFKKLGENNLDFYETRKITFKSPGALNNEPEKGILKALEFELLWLKNKIGYYKSINLSDVQRMNMIEQRYLNAINSLI